MCASPARRVDLALPQAETLPLFQREVRERLSPTALELLLSRAEIFVEGAAATGASARGAFLGTALLTFDLPALAGRLRPPLDGAAALRLAAALQADPAALRALCVRALAAARARLAAPASLRAGEPTLRADGARVLVDVELEAPAPKATHPKAARPKALKR